MSKGGGFGGGGFKGGGFSSGGFKSSGGGRPNGTNFSSFRPNSGARPPSSNNTSMHNSGSSFLWGAVVGSILNQRTGQNTTQNNTHPVYNDTYMRGAPIKPAPEPKYREFKYCEYCKSEFTDLNLNKCPNCGAKLEHKKVLEGQPTTNAAATGAYQSQYNTVPQATKPKSKAWIVPIIILVVAVMIIATALSGSGKVISDEIVTWVQPNSPALTRYYTTADLITSDYLQFQVTGVEVVDEISELDLAYESGVKYVVIQTKIININAFDIPIYIRDFSIKYNGENYQPLQVNYSWYYNFDSGSGLSKYFVLGTFEVMEGVLLYKIDNYVEGDIKFEYIEYEYDEASDSNYLIGIYQVDIH